MSVGSIDPEQRRIATRLVLAALRRFHRERPLAADIRLDTLVSRVRAAADRRPPPRHRGSARLELTDIELRVVIEEMADDGRVVRTGRRVRLPEVTPGFDPEMQARVDRLLDGLRAAGAEPPRVEALAARLGIPPMVIDQLRHAGVLRSIGPGIDYPADVWVTIAARVEDMRGQPSVARVRDAFHTSRRHAEAILAATARPVRPTGPRRH